MNWKLLAAILAFLGVGLGAFGAHGLKDLLTQNQTLEIWKTASFYHLVHAVAMLVGDSQTQRFAPAGFFAVGILIFSGSLYLLALTGTSWLGAVTPLGGVAFLLGWLRLAWLARR